MPQPHKSILVLVERYPSPNSPYAMAYAHTRSLYYRSKGHHVTVLCFSAKSNYEIDGISVHCESTVNPENFDLLVSHAPNLRNHFRYLLKVRRSNICFFIHGHEVLNSTSDYPAPYDWQPKYSLFRKVYEQFKLQSFPLAIRLLSRWNNLSFIFVSNWMKEQFIKNTAIDLQSYCHTVIPNAVHPAFLKNQYNPKPDASGIITIRPLDERKYGIDLVVKCAVANPAVSFSIYGQGEYFRRNPTPKNVKWIPHFLEQNRIPDLLNKYSAALMPTLYDSQGVAVCEMASFGIPTITSNIDIAKEMVGDYHNTLLVDNDAFSLLDISTALNSMTLQKSNCSRFHGEKLTDDELNFMIESALDS